MWTPQTIPTSSRFATGGCLTACTPGARPPEPNPARDPGVRLTDEIDRHGYVAWCDGHTAPHTDDPVHRRNGTQISKVT